MVVWMSCMLSSRGTGVFFGPVAVKMSWSAEIAEGATGRRRWGVLSGWDMRPTCISWMNSVPPPACTASATSRQPAICSGVWMPGVFGYPCPSAEGCVPSVMTSPREARCP